MVSRISRKAQHEMVGFILIVVLVVVVSLIFLGISLRQKPSGVESESKQVVNLLNSILQYTTDCAIYVPQYESVRDLIKSCYHAETCIGGVSTCQKLQEVLTGLLESAQPHMTGGVQVIRGYEFNASYVAEQAGFFARPAQADITYLSKGTCKQRSISNSIGAQEFLPLDAGTIRISLRFCY